MLSLYELMPDKSQTVVARNELESKILDLLRAKKISEAITLMAQLKSDERLFEIAREALEIAQSLRDAGSIKQLVCLPFSKYNSSGFFVLSIKTLLQFNEDAAVTLVLFKKLSGHDRDLGWKILQEHYIKTDDLMKLEVIYDHLTERYNKQELAEYFLNSQKIFGDGLVWITWYGRYLSVVNRTSLAQFDEKAAEVVTGEQDFAKVLETIQSAFPDENRKNFFEDLYLRWLKSAEYDRCGLLEKELTEDQRWLIKLKDLIATGNGFEVLQRVPFGHREWVIHRAVSQFINAADSQAAIYHTLLACIGEEPRDQRQIFTVACRQCVTAERFDDAISLIPHIEQYYVNEAIESIALCGKLSEHQQATLLRVVDFEGALWKKIKENFLPSVLESEQIRRDQERIQRVKKQYLPLKNVGQKNKKHREIFAEIRLMTHHAHYEDALELCAVLTPSEQRDGLIDGLIEGTVVLDPINFEFCAKASQLYRDKDARVSWKNFFTAVSKGNQREVIKASLKCVYKKFAYASVSIAVAHVLNEKNPNNAIEFLRSTGFLASNWVSNEMKEKVIDLLLMLYSEDIPKLIKRVKGWVKSNIKGYEELVVGRFLESGQLRFAIQCLNSIIPIDDEDDDDEFKEDPCFRQVKTYLSTAEPAVELFSAVKLVVNQSAREILLRKICTVACDVGVDNALEIIKACPNKELKKEYLELLLDLYLSNSSYDLASATFSSLTWDAQEYWGPIIHNLKTNHYREILNHWIQTGRFVSALTRVVITNLLKDMDSNAILDEFCAIYKVWETLSQIKPLTDEASFDDSIKRYAAKQECDRILSLISQQWYNVCFGSADPAISDIVKGLKIILPWHAETHAVYVLISKVKQEVFEAANAFVGIQEFLLLLSVYKQLDYREIESYEKRLYEAETFGDIESLIQFMRQYKMGHEASLSSERLVKVYIKKKKFQEVIRFVPDDMNFSERRLLMGCVEKHLKALDLVRVQCLIDKLTINLTESDALALVSYFLNANYLIEGKLLFKAYVKTPTQVHALEKKIIECYWKKLTQLLTPGDTTVSIICASYTKVAQIKTAVDEGNEQQAICLQTEVVQLMRPLLDIGFRAYCERAFPNVDIKTLYFPMVSSSDDGDPATVLDDRLRGFRLGQFRADQSQMFDFLLSIQPAVDAKYTWLKTLFSMSNIIKHQSNITFNEVSVNFLTDLVNGVTFILLKLSNPRSPVLDLKQYCPSEFVDLEQLAKDLTQQNSVVNK